MNKASHLFRFYTLGIVVLAGFALLVAKLWEVQILKGDEYAAKIRNRSQLTVRLPAVRGEIFDRNGVLLAGNRANFEVDFYLPGLVRAYREKYGEVPMTEYRAVIRGMYEYVPVEDVEKIIREEVIDRLEELGIAEEYNSERIQIHYQQNSEVPFNYLETVDFETMVRFMENNLNLPGVRVEIQPVRHYVYGAFAPHILGYTGAPTNIDREEASQYNFYQPDIVGKAHVELQMDEYLRGTPGVRVLERDAKGVITGEVERREPVQGDNVYLTLDARIQAIAENALRVVGRGAAVVIEPKTGDVLAMASVPSFDPNIFIPSISAADWTALNADDTHPLINRGTSAYPPGSTFKIPVALAGLRAGVGDRSFNCSGGVQYGRHYMRCWQEHGHGSLGLEDAIKVSCNAYFYQFGNAAEIDHITAVGNMLGLGQRSGIPLSGETPGILPGRDWLAENHPMERWSSGYTANTSIGQGFVLTTPLQMAMVTAAVANGGIVYYPRLIDKVVDQEGNVVLQEPVKVRANLVDEGGISAEGLERVRGGMRAVVNEGGGTARRARIEGKDVAGKTGTAQYLRGTIKDNRSWFIAFAPYDDPQYAVCVMIEGGESGGLVAAPIAGKILEDTFKLEEEPEEPEEGETEKEEEKEEAFKLEFLEPAKGNFRHVALVDFGRDIPATFGTDGETAATAPAPEQRSETQTAQAAAPTVRPDADERGRVQNTEERSGIQRFFDMFRGGSRDREPREQRQRRQR